MKKYLTMMWCMTLLLMLCLLPGFAMAADGVYGDTTKNFPEDFTDGKYQPKNAISTFALDRSKTVDQAIADGDIPLASKERLEGIVSQYLDHSVSYADGLITIRVDLADSDWGNLLLTANPYPYVSVRHSLDRPSDAYETHVGFSGGFGEKTLEYVLGLMEDGIRWDSNNIQSSNGIFIGEIVPNQSLLLPTESGTSMNLICWLDQDDPAVRHYEYYEVEYIISSSGPIHIPFRYVTEHMLEASEDVYPRSGVKIKNIADGDITFQVTGSNVNNLDLPIVLNAPQSATRMVITQPEWRSQEQYNVSNGKVTMTWQLHDGKATHEEQFTIGWYDNAGNLVEYGIFMLHCEPEDYAAWPYYESDWHAPDADRMTLVNECEDIGITFEYNENTGDLHIGYDKNATITGRVGAVIAHLKAPANAKYYRVNHSGGNNIMGQHSDMAADQNSFTPAQDLEVVPEDRNIEVMYYIPVREINAGPVQVFLQIGEGEAWPYAGGIFTIFWYEDEESALNTPGKPMLKEYVSDTMGAMCVTNRIPVVESEEEITEPVEEVTCVGGRYYREGWRLVVRRYPHRGSKAFHYELTLENEYGVYQPLEGNMVFYMPYPKDYFSHPEYTFSLRHYSNDYNDYTLVDVSETEYGVRFEVASLSPFVLDWGGYVDDGGSDDGGNGGNDGGNNGNDGGSDDGDRPKYQLKNLHLNNGTTTVNKSSIRDVQLWSNAKVQIHKSRIENMSMDYNEESNGSIQIKDTAVEMLNLIISNRTPTNAGKALLTFDKDSALGVLFVVILEGEEAPAQAITGPLVKFEGEKELAALIINGDCRFFDPAMISGDVTFDQIHVEQQGAEPIEFTSYAEFLAYIGK